MMLAFMVMATFASSVKNTFLAIGIAGGKLNFSSKTSIMKTMIYNGKLPGLILSFSHHKLGVAMNFKYAHKSKPLALNALDKMIRRIHFYDLTR